jgi:hypothetical protein
MPMKSQAQRAYLHANKPELAAEFEKATPKGADLPDHVAKAKARKGAVKPVKRPKVHKPAPRRRR